MNKARTFTGRCNSRDCKRVVVMMLSPNSKWMPLDPDYVAPDGVKLLTFDDGTTGKQHATEPDALGRISHFATCVDSKKFQRHAS